MSSPSSNPSALLALRGLIEDAVYQVLDNKVFRVLLGMALIPISATFIVGLKEDSFSILFGLYEYDYPDFMLMLGEDRTVWIEYIVKYFIDSWIGGLGMTLVVAATAFFVPRMLEKGAADLVFVKPMPRWALYLSRYVTGILFVAFLSVFLTVGMYLGILLVSDFNAPALLWSTFSLIYLFALIHGVTMLIGVYTRSTSAAMILGIGFFFGNGCVHTFWQVVDQNRELIEMGEDMVAEAEEEPKEEEDDSSAWQPLIHGAIVSLDALHYTLPKTSDASLVALHVQDALLGTDRTESRRQISDNNKESQGRRLAEAEAESGEELPPGFGEQEPADYFEDRFGWDAEELRYNTWFSLLSSIAFTVFVLLLGMWKLRRSDF